MVREQHQGEQPERKGRHEYPPAPAGFLEPGDDDEAQADQDKARMDQANAPEAAPATSAVETWSRSENHR
jgi:hypothetical protein